MENKDDLNEFSIKEEQLDEDYTGSSSIEENSKIKNEFEVKTEVKTEYGLDLIDNEAGQDTKESLVTHVKGTVLDESYVGIKLETVSDEDAIKDELDEPDFVSLEDVDETQTDTDYEIKNQTFNNAPTDKHTANATVCETSQKDESRHKIYKCATCTYQSRYRNKFIRHLEKHKDLPFNCNICGRVYTRRCFLEDHMLKHMAPEDRPMFSCDECEYKTVRKSALTRHKLSHVQVDQAKLIYKCDKCPYETKYPYHHKRHEQKHKGPYKCDICGCTCIRKLALEKHMLIHLDPKDRPTYNCDVCAFKTLYKNRIQLHKEAHVKQMKSMLVKSEKSLKYKCTLCYFRTNDPSSYRKHMPVHTNRADRKLYECATCGRTYTAKAHLSQHMLLHMDPAERPTYDCEVCGYKTIYKCRMQKHKLNHAKPGKVSCSIKNETEQSQM